MTFLLNAFLVLSSAIWFLSWLFAWLAPRTLTVILLALLFVGFLGHALIEEEIPPAHSYPSLDEMTQIQPKR